jgi:hypothetical protein
MIVTLFRRGGYFLVWESLKLVLDVPDKTDADSRAEHREAKLPWGKRMPFTKNWSVKNNRIVN